MRNPFELEDVPGVIDPDVEEFARKIEVPADPSTDENALAWVTIATDSDGLEGPWTSRWNGGEVTDWKSGVATVRVNGDRVFILYKDTGTYLIEAQIRGDRLVGRYVNANKPDDTSPWLGIIVNPYRIDGYWKRGRWDLRRCSPEERPEPIVAALVTEARQLGANDLRELLGFARYLRWRTNKTE